MTSKIFVGNLPFSVDNDRLKDEFTKFGEVLSAKVIMDRHSGRSKGFGFVEFAEVDSAQSAIDGMNEKPLEGRNLTVSFAKSQT